LSSSAYTWFHEEQQERYIESYWLSIFKRWLTISLSDVLVIIGACTGVLVVLYLWSHDYFQMIWRRLRDG
jgi:hypothetical protein